MSTDAVGTYVDTQGRSYVTTITKAEWEKQRARADAVHVVQHERSEVVDK